MKDELLKTEFLQTKRETAHQRLLAKKFWEGESPATTKRWGTAYDAVEQ